MKEAVIQRHTLLGSERRPSAGARLVGPSDPTERFEVTVLLRRQAAAVFAGRIGRLDQGGGSLAFMSSEEFVAVHGASSEDIDAVKNFASVNNLFVLATNAARRSMVLSGTVLDFNAAFGVALHQYEHESGRYRGREGAITLPTELRDIVQGVFGLDNRPQARVHFRRKVSADDGGTSTGYSPIVVASLYGFPAGTGAGQTIGIIELGGGTRASDLQTYFSSLGLQQPHLISVSVDNAQNQETGDPSGPDAEVMLDVEVAGSIAPGATLVAYFAPNTDAGFLNAITTAIHDVTNRPSIISISWGAPEANWTAQAMEAFEQAFQDAAVMGITVCVATGDRGSSDGVSDGTNNVNFPASCPHALACGGTSLQAVGGAISSETVWNDGADSATGGGISGHFSVPNWQAGLFASVTAGGGKTLSGRGVPDVAGNADPETGYYVLVHGKNAVIGGTSAVAPLWAGMIARVNEMRGGKVGFINPLLYQNQNAFNDVTSGNNGAFAAAVGWDACTGLGSPNGAALVHFLGGISVTQSGAFLVSGALVSGADAFLIKGNDVSPTGNILVGGKALGIEPTTPWPRPGKK